MSDNGDSYNAPFSPSLGTRVQDLLDRTEYRRICDAGEAREIYQLRYNAYFSEGAIQPNGVEYLKDEYDDAQNAYLIGVFIDGDLAGSIRLHLIDSQSESSPAMSTYDDVLGELRTSSTKILDPNRFVANQRVSRKCPELPFVTLRIPFMAAEYFNVNYATATARREHMPFYKKYLRYKKITDPRPYPTLTKPLGLMLVSFQEEREAVVSKYPFFAGRPGEAESLLG